MSTFADRVALVTGGSRGIGLATALRLAADGADVAISFGSRQADADKAVAQIQQLGRRAVAVQCDVSQPDQVQRMVDTTRRELGPIDLLAHCGAISNVCTHNELTWDRWRETIDVNLNGAYLVMFAVKDEMLARQYGRIVMISSIAALRPRAMQIHYATAKLGVVALTRCCAEAFAPHVRVNCITPGLTDTEMMHVLPEERIAAIAAETPLQRVGQPEEIAGAIRFLLSDESSFMTGQTVSVCGGRVMLP
ncbi:MAG: SDR family NAD(P)-dependent oxidoreductase [Pirellulales bacterium]